MSPGADGLLVMDKEPGVTSHDVVDMARRALGTRRVGHTGTLDPLASGVLLLLLGGATRLAQVLAGQEKSYTGEARLGWSTDTYDRTGRPTSTPRAAVHVDAARLRDAAAHLAGEQLQTPPPYSARKVDGVRLHRRARRGEAVTGRPKAVFVRRFHVEPAGTDRFHFQAQVSAGTYIRALVHELGARLECGAHLTELRRIAAGPFGVDRALPLERLRREPGAVLEPPHFVPFDALPLELPRVAVDAEAAEALRHGRPFSGTETPLPGPDPRPPTGSGRAGGLLQVRDPEGRLVALARRGPGGLFHPRTVFRRFTE